VHAAVIEKLLLYPQDCILRSLSDAEFYDGFGWNLDLLLRCGISELDYSSFYGKTGTGKTNCFVMEVERSC
jgi:hypothetical protein